MADVRQFVVQRHDTGEEVHWDLMLEQDEALATWQVPVPPEEIAGTPINVERIADHPKRFLTYEGPLRSHPGSVRIHDRGSYVALTPSENNRHINVSIEGKRMKGIFCLRRQGDPRPPGSPDIWTVVRTGGG